VQSSLLRAVVREASQEQPWHEVVVFARRLRSHRGGSLARRSRGRTVLTRSLPFSPRESSKSVCSGATGGHWGVSSGTPVRVRTARESAAATGQRASSRSSGPKRRDRVPRRQRGCVKRAEAKEVLLNQGSGSRNWDRTSNPGINSLVLPFRFHACCRQLGKRVGCQWQLGGNAGDRFWRSRGTGRCQGRPDHAHGLFGLGSRRGRAAGAHLRLHAAVSDLPRIPALPAPGAASFPRHLYFCPRSGRRYAAGERCHLRQRGRQRRSPEGSNLGRLTRSGRRTVGCSADAFRNPSDVPLVSSPRGRPDLAGRGPHVGPMAADRNGRTDWSR